MAKIKTQENNASVDAFVAAIPDLVKREDCGTLVKLFSLATGQEPKMWGEHIVGFGKRHYTYANGKPGEMCKVGFAPRSKSFALYLATFPDSDTLYKQLGKYKFQGGCLHITKIADINPEILKIIVKKSFSQKIVDSHC